MMISNTFEISSIASYTVIKVLLTPFVSFTIVFIENKFEILISPEFFFVK